MHKVLENVFRQSGPLQAPWQLKTVLQIPGFRHLTARLIGVGVLPEHVKRPTARPTCPVPTLKKIAIGAGLVLAGAAIGVGILRGLRKRSHGWSAA